MEADIYARNGQHETGGLSLLDGNLKRGYVDGHFSTNGHSGIMVGIQHNIMAILQNDHSTGEFVRQLY